MELFKTKALVAVEFVKENWIPLLVGVVIGVLFF